MAHPAVPQPDPAVPVALAEFEALRSEIVAGRQIQGALLGVGLTAVGVVLTIALQDEGHPQLLAAVPPLALVVSLLHLAETSKLHRLGAHIRRRTWPFLQQRTGYPHSWEQERFDEPWHAGVVVSAVVFEGAVPLLFAVVAATALLVGDGLSARTQVVGWVLVALTVLSHAVFALTLRARPS